jgi:ankyrin repeat protein
MHFQFAISCGNLPVVQDLISYSTKHLDGCHPSLATATKDKKTPLQLAISSGNISMVECLLRYATAHDVEKCWKQLVDKDKDKYESIRDVLASKVGFTSISTRSTLKLMV